MKKFYTLLCLALTGLLAFSASAAQITINFNVDDPARVAIEIEYEAVQGLVAGDNPLTFDAYSTVKISAVNGATLESVTEENGLYTPYISGNSTTMYPGANLDGARFLIVTKGSEDVRTASLKLDVDKASAIKAVFDETSYEPELSDGANTVKYDPVKEKTLKIYSSVSAQMPLYSVTLEGATTGSLSQRGNVWFLALPTDGTLSVKSQFPDKDCTVSFAFSEGAEGFVKKVTKDSADGETVEIKDGKAVVKAGSVLFIHGDTDNFLLSEYTVDGDQLDFSSPQRLLVKDADIALSFTARAYAAFTATVTVENPEAILARYGSNMTPGATIELIPGDNTVNLNENRNSLLFVPADAHDFRILSATLNGDPVEPNYSGHIQMSDLRAGDKIVLTTETIVRDINAVVYLDNADENMWTLKDAFGKEIQLSTGYNHLKICAEDNPLSLCEGYGMPYVYANDEPVASSGSFFSKAYKFSLAEGGVAKIYVDTDDEPAFHALSFKGEAFADVDVLLDEITPLTQALGYEVLVGTKVEIAPKDGKKITAKLDDTDLEPADGKYSFIVSGPHTITLQPDGSTGIDSIDATVPAERVIYNLQGIRVKASDASALPAGLYIVDGVKTLVK